MENISVTDVFLTCINARNCMDNSTKFVDQPLTLSRAVAAISWLPIGSLRFKGTSKVLQKSLQKLRQL